MRQMKNENAYSLTEVVIAIAVIAIMSIAAGLALFRFRDNVEYDILLNKVTESINYTKLKATQSRLDSDGNRISYGVRFFENRIVEFEGETYVEGADANVEYEVPIGLRLGTSCSPFDDGTVVFSPVEGNNDNECTINIYRFEQSQPIGSVSVSSYGVEDAS